MKILSRYIFKECFLYFIICLTTFTTLLLTIRILKFTNLIVNKGVEISQIVKIFTSIIPTFLEIALPMSVLLGVMLAFARMSGDSEIVVLRASGVTLKQILRPIIFFGIFAMSLSYYISLELRPEGYRLFNQTLFDIAKSKSTAGITAGFFNKLGSLTIYTDKINYDTGELVKTLIEDNRNIDNKKIIFAKKGEILSNNQTRKIIINLEDGEIHEKKVSNYGITKFLTNRLVLSQDDLYSDLSLKEDKRGRELSLSELTNEIAVFDEKKQEQDLTIKERQDIIKRFNRLNLEFLLRFSMPIMTLVFAILAVPLGIMPPRTQKTWGSTISLLFGLGMFILYYGILSVCMAMGENGSISYYFSGIVPNLTLIFLTFYVIKQSNSEKWNSITDGLFQLTSFIRKKND